MVVVAFHRQAAWLASPGIGMAALSAPRLRSSGARYGAGPGGWEGDELAR